MRHVRMLGLCLIAVFGVAALAATSASALPEFGKCVVQAKHEGKYTDSACVKKAKKVGEKFTGEFEWKKAIEVKEEGGKLGFTGEAGAGVLEGRYFACEKEGSVDSEAGRKPKCPEGDERNELTIGEKPIRVECESESNHGEIAATKASKEVKNVSVTFRGCKALGTVPCSNTQTEGEIHVNTLKGKLGYINKKVTPREVGIQLEPAVKKGEFANFSCVGGQLGTVVGEGNSTEGCAYPLTKCGGDGIIGAQTPVNEMTNHYTQKFVMNEETQENIPSKFEGTAPKEVLESYIFNEEEPQLTSQWSKAGETITNVTSSEEQGEVKAN